MDCQYILDGPDLPPLLHDPLGYILLQSDILCPFGILPPATEAAFLGDPKTWKEIKVSPPLGMYIDTKVITCPVTFCRETLKKHHSVEFHLKKHILRILSPNNTSLPKTVELQLPKNVPLRYYCSVDNCSYNYKKSDGSRNFSRLKYLRQHFLKVHAPKTHSCSLCSKTFSTLVFLEIHKRMCGNSFNCSSCSSTYVSLEALQTHCRRKSHTYDYEKYRHLIQTLKQESQAKRSEETLKNKLAAVSLAGKSVGCSKKYDKIPVLVPKPTTITICGAESHVTWTYQNGTESPKLKVEMGTQTELVPDDNSPASFTSSKAKTENKRQAKRKKSAETQTAKIRCKISTETQTSNVRKRRRLSKREIEEAQTQSSPVPSPETPSSMVDSFDYLDKYPEPQLSKGEAESGSVAAMNYPSPFELSDLCYPNAGVATSEMCVGNRFDEAAQQLFDLEELHRETQTEPNSFYGASTSLYALSFDQSFDLDDSIDKILPLVTTETQTWVGSGLSLEDDWSAFFESHSSTDRVRDTYLPSGFDLLPETTTQNHQDPLDFLQQDVKGGSLSFLETTDNETQTSLQLYKS